MLRLKPASWRAEVVLGGVVQELVQDFLERADEVENPDLG
jgi:hypothetical protein